MAVPKITTSAGTAGLLDPYSPMSIQDVLAQDKYNMEMNMRRIQAEMEMMKAKDAKDTATHVRVKPMKNGGFTISLFGEDYFAGDAQTMGEIIVGAMAAQKFQE